MLGFGECDFETHWCGWKDNSTSTSSRWHRSMDKSYVPSKTAISG